MPEVRRDVRVSLPTEAVWHFVADIDRWAHDVPGYRSHTAQSVQESLWTIAGDLGMLSREAEVRVTVTNWDEPREVTFTVEGTEEPIEGDGRFSTAPDGPDGTLLGFELALRADGPLGPVINVLLKTFLPKVADQFVTSLAADLEERGASPPQP